MLHASEQRMWGRNIFHRYISVSEGAKEGQDTTEKQRALAAAREAVVDPDIAADER